MNDLLELRISYAVSIWRTEIGHVLSLKHIIREAAKGPVEQPTASPDALINQSFQARSGLVKFSSALANEIDSIFDLAAPKTLQRFFEKAAKKYDGNCARVLDLTRGSIPVDSVEQIEAVDRILDPQKNSEFLANWAKKGYFVREYENFFAAPTRAGLRGIVIKLEVPFSNGNFHICELQIQHVAMLDALAKSHPFFEEQRHLIDEIDPDSKEINTATAAKYVNLRETRKQIHDDAAQAADLNLLVKNRAYFAEDTTAKPAPAQKFDMVG